MTYDIFKNEKQVMDQAQQTLERKTAIDPADYETLLNEYRKLSKTAHRLIKLSDRNEDSLRKATQKITEQKDELERTQSHLIKAEKLASLGELVAGVAHELNTPLGILLTASTTLGRDTQIVLDKMNSAKLKKSDVKSYLAGAETVSRLVETHAAHAADLIKSFMAVSVDRTNDEVRTLKLGPYLGDILNSLSPEFKGRKIETELTGDLSIEVTTWPGALNQIVTNLVLNALRHGFQETDVGTITLALKTENNTVILRVSDNGQGISPDIRDRIFDPFVTTARDQGGTGLGLHIVHNLVVGRLNGQIEVESPGGPTGRGTVLTLTLPQYLNKLDPS